LKIGIPIGAAHTAEAVEKIKRANELADLLEFRLDLLENCRLEEMTRVAAKPVIATYRSARQGGAGTDNYETQRGLLLRGLEGGAHLVDVEIDLPRRYREDFRIRPGPERTIVSKHWLEETPSWTALRELLLEMAASGASLIKIVTRARAVEDNLRVLRLIPEARKKGLEIIAFCMGPLGRISRIASPLLGGYMTFASLEAGEESAPGQIPAREMRWILNRLSPPNVDATPVKGREDVWDI
jgi:3-dehydroquinate dehydratase type I